MKSIFKKLGPGLLFAGAAIGVSHLVQSTRAGADFGWSLLWILFAAHLLKYPFFEFGTRYALATQESLLEGYARKGKMYLRAYFMLNMGTMFTIQTAVTVVTASLASALFGVTSNLTLWSIIITFLCTVLLWRGKYALLDFCMKWIIAILTISTLVAVGVAGTNTPNALSFAQRIPDASSLVFIAAFIGWMPAPLDLSIWQSIWALEKNKTEKISSKEGLFDFNFGYLITFFLGICFMGLGAFVMHQSGNSFSTVGGVFAQQLIELYTSTLGQNIAIFISIAAFTTMLSTTLTTLDASPRAMERIVQILSPDKTFFNYRFWLIVLALGTCAIFTFFQQEMGTLVKIATVLSFVTAPFYALLNYRLICGDNIPKEFRIGTFYHIASVLGIIFLMLFALVFIFVVL